MLDRKAIFETLKPVMVNNVAKNVRSINRYFIDGSPVGENFMGSAVDPKPFEGKVIHINDDVVLVKEKVKDFYIIDKSLMTTIPDLGDKVEVTPYFRREFDGQRLGSTVKVDTQYMDGIFLNANSCLVGDGQTRIPGPAVKNQELLGLIEYLQCFKLSDGFRRVTHLMVDSNAKNFVVIDPVGDDQRAPSFKFSVDSNKFKGDINFIYHYSLDTFSVHFYGNDTEIEIVDNVYFDDIAKVLEDHLDDGLSKQVSVCLITKTKKK